MSLVLCKQEQRTVKNSEGCHHIIREGVFFLYTPLSAVCPAGFPTPGYWSPVEQSSLSRPRPLSTHTLPESETNSYVSEHSRPVDEIHQMVSLTLIFIHEGKSQHLKISNSTTVKSYSITNSSSLCLAAVLRADGPIALRPSESLQALAESCLALGSARTNG